MRGILQTSGCTMQAVLAAAPMEPDQAQQLITLGAVYVGEKIKVQMNGMLPA